MSLGQHIDDFISKSKKFFTNVANHADDTVKKTGNKYVDEVAEALSKTEGNKVVDEAVYDASKTVKSGKRAGKMSKKDISAKKAEIQARLDARHNGEDVKLPGNLGGVNEGDRNVYSTKINDKNYQHTDGKWWKETGKTEDAVVYENVDFTENALLNERFQAEPNIKSDKERFIANTTHDEKQKIYEGVWTPRTEKDLNDANRGWRQRTLDNLEEKASNTWDHLSGQNRRRTTANRRQYNQQVFDSGQGEFITTNSEYKRMERK